MEGTRDFREPRHPFMKITRPYWMQPVRGLCLTDEPLLYDIHRFQRRTIPCYRPSTCLFCGRFAAEQRIFLPLKLGTGELAMMDLPPSHWETMLSLETRHNGLLGLILTATRMGESKTSPIRIQATADWRIENGMPEQLLQIPSRLAQILEKNTQFAIEAIEAAKSASTDQPRLSDRGVIRGLSHGKLFDVQGRGHEN